MNYRVHLTKQTNDHELINDTDDRNNQFFVPNQTNHGLFTYNNYIELQCGLENNINFTLLMDSDASLCVLKHDERLEFQRLEQFIGEE